MSRPRAKVPKTGLDESQIKTLGKSLFVKPIDQQREKNRRMANTNEKQFLLDYDAEVAKIDAFVQELMIKLRALIGGAKFTNDPEESTEIALGVSRHTYSMITAELDKMYPFDMQAKVTIGKKLNQ